MKIICLQHSYWCGTKPEDYVPEDKTISIGQVPELFEEDPTHLRPGIQIRNLRKVRMIHFNLLL